MRQTLLSCLVITLFTAGPALADHKAGQYTGVRKCTGAGGGHWVDATSKRTIGVASCKGELQKALKAKGVCLNKPRNQRVDFEFTFGSDKDPDQTKGSFFLLCS